MFLLLLATLVITATGKGVTRWCSHNNKYLSAYSSGTYVYSTLSAAKSACLNKNDCFGITRENSARYTLRKGWILNDSPSREVSYIPCEGYFNCDSFGLISTHGKYLSAQSDGDVEWNRAHYGAWEHITFEQWGKDSGFLKSFHGKYLAATSSNKLEWNRDAAGAWEKFTVQQYEDKIGLKSYHNKYLSAQSDGSADVDRTQLQAWEWFTVSPQNCLNNIECDCSRGITDDYESIAVVYIATQGSVEAYKPEKVGYQHINNEGSSIEQSTSFSVSEEVTETASFTHTAGASISVGVEFEVGIPLIASGTVTTEVTASYEFSAGTERSETKTMAAVYNCAAPAGRTVTCEALLFKYRMSVPYTQTWRHKRLGCTCQTSGVFEEIAASEMRLTVDEQDVVTTAGSGGFKNS